jgi:PhoH-like ATPase
LVALSLVSFYFLSLEFVYTLGKKGTLFKEDTKINMKKTYVLDTNVLLNDPNAILSFQDNDVIIPMVVLEELDHHKSRMDEVGHNARSVSRTLDGMRSLNDSLIDGVSLPEGGILRVVSVDSTVVKEKLPVELDPTKADNVIISLMLGLPRDYILVSKDINVRIKCDALGISSEDYLKLRITNDPKTFYKGVEVVELSEEEIDKFYFDEKLVVDIPQVKYPNQVVIIKHVENEKTVKSAITKLKIVDGVKTLLPIEKFENVFGLKPRNKEQAFSLDLLFDPEVKLLTLVGLSGSGKTLLALAAALEQLKGIGSPEAARYSKLIVTKPVQPVGKDIGFLPGTLQEKMEPWISPIKDNLNFLMGSKRGNAAKVRGGTKTENGWNKTDSNAYLSLMQEKGLIEIEAITFIRGRSIPNSFIVIDEAQNLTMHELKTIITRVGDGTKIVLTGDIEQIDNVHVDAYTCGLTYAIEKFKEYDLAGHVTMLKGERSELATLASQIL